MFVEFVCDDVVNREDNLDIVLLSFLDQRSDFLGSSLVEQRVTDLHCNFNGYNVQTTKARTATFSRVFLKVNAIPPQMINELTCYE
jgi:hypothetical protein